MHFNGEHLRGHALAKKMELKSNRVPQTEAGQLSAGLRHGCGEAGDQAIHQRRYLPLEPAGAAVDPERTTV